MAVKVRKLTLTAAVLAAGMILLTACNLPSLEPVSEVRYPYCLSTLDLHRPDTVYPEKEIIEELSPVFSWAYTGDCRPRNFQIQVNQTSYCHEWAGDDRRIIDEEIGGYTEWTPDVPLDPMTAYQWRVAPIIMGEMGEFSEHVCFYTGPTCEADSLEAPLLGGPLEGEVINRDYVILGWHEPETCFVEGFQAELSDDPTFPPPNFMSEIPLDRISPFAGQVSGEIPLEDCTTYYWRVRSRVDTIWSPYSETWSFETDFDGTCTSDMKSGPTPVEDHTPTPVDPSPTPIGPTPIDPSPTPIGHSPTPVVISPTPLIPSVTPYVPTKTYTPHPPTRTLTPTVPSPTIPVDNQPPPVPNPVSPSGSPTLGCTSFITVNWDAVSDPSGIAEYRVQLGRHSGDGSWSPPPGSPYIGISGTSTSVQVECGWYYRWRVRAIDGADNWSNLSSWAYFTVSLE